MARPVASESWTDTITEDVEGYAKADTCNDQWWPFHVLEPGGSLKSDNGLKHWKMHLASKFGRRRARSQMEHASTAA